MTKGENGKSQVLRQAGAGLAFVPAALALLIFSLAGTVHYWQGWVFWGLWVVSFCGITIDLMVKDPGLLARRMQRKETRSTQRTVMALFKLLFVCQIVVSIEDHRFAWSVLPSAAVIGGDVAIAAGFWTMLLVMRANRYAAATVQVEHGQTLSDKGLYGVIRHPYYSGLLLLLFGMPPALGSAWGLLFSLALAVGIVIRLLDEEHLLTEELQGYLDYCSRVRYRLIPKVW